MLHAKGNTHVASTQRKQTSTFPARPDGTSVLQEYRYALDDIVIHPSLMRHSSVHAAMFAISNANSETQDGTSFDEYLRCIMEKAYPRQENSYQPTLFDSFAASSDKGRLYTDILSLYNDFPLRQKTQMKRGFELLLNNRVSDLRGLLKVLADAKNKEDACKRKALYSLIKAVKDFLPTDMISDTGSLNAYSIVTNTAARFVENWKEAAFESAFLKPSVLYFYLTKGNKQGVDVDVHGTNYHAALLEATTGIRVPHVPFWGDREAKGLVDFLDAGLQEALPVIQSPKNMDKGLEELMIAFPPTVFTHFRRVPQQKFIFNNVKDGNRMTPYAMSLRALDASRKAAPQRMLYATYLNTFGSYFTEDVVLAPMVEYLCADNTSLEALQRIFMDLKAELASSAVPSMDGNSVEASAFCCSDVRSWIWDKSTKPGDRVLNKKAAKLLFAQCGVVKAVSERTRERFSSHKYDETTALKVAHTAVPIEVV